jgi:membrane protein DedA with SNARE-associated domain
MRIKLLSAPSNGYVLVSRRNLERLKGKAPQLLFLAIAIVVILIISLDTLEDMIEGGTFVGAPLDLLFRAVITFTQNVTATISSWGYAGIFSLMLLESSSLPIPSEVILPFAGYLISQGLLNLWITISISTVAGITGSLIDYYIGLKGMNLITRRKILGKLLLNEGRLQTTERWFKKYGALVVFLSRMIPGFRTLVSFPAGAVKMPLPKFIPYTMAGCLAWNAVLIYIGMYLGVNWREVPSVLHYIIIGLAAVILVALVVFLIRRKKKT